MTFQNYSAIAGAESVYAFLGGFPQIRTSADFAAGFRETVEQDIERLIALLDAIDGDSELEPDHDAEPALVQNEWTGAWETHDNHLYGFDARQDTYLVDREHDVGDMAEDELDLSEGEDDEDREPDEEGEPLLGWTLEGENGDQASIQYGDDEPSLGWTGSGWTSNTGGTDDEREDNAADNADEDAGDQGEPDDDREPDLGWRCDKSLDQSSLTGGEAGGYILDGEAGDAREGEIDTDESVFFYLSHAEREPVETMRDRLRKMRRRQYKPDACTILRPGVARMGVWS